MHQLYHANLLTIKKVHGLYLILSGQIPRSLLRTRAEDYILRMSERILKSDNVSVLVYHLVCPAK